MGNLYGEAYSNMRKGKIRKPHIVVPKDLENYMPKFIVASAFPKMLEGRVILFSEWDEPENALVEWTDRSRVQYFVLFEGKEAFKSYDIRQALEFYNNL